MDSRLGSSYWETQILTAPPAKLRLMLIEGTIRQVQLALAAWQRDDPGAGFQHLTHGRDIVAELLGSARGQAGDLGKQIAALYLFVFQQLVYAQSDRDPQRLEQALRVLDEERETWRAVCTSPAAGGGQNAAHESVHAPLQYAPPAPHHTSSLGPGTPAGPAIGSSLIIDA